ncbi:MAG: gamma carbonic anhydrase family protein, partial [Spirochaetes bacterium]
LGSPAKIIKPLKEGVIARSLENSARYVRNKDKYLKAGIGKV